MKDAWKNYRLINLQGEKECRAWYSEPTFLADLATDSI